MSYLLSLAEGRFRAHAIAFGTVLLLVALLSRTVLSGQGETLMGSVVDAYGPCLGAALVLLALEVAERGRAMVISIDSAQTRSILVGFFVIFGAAAWLHVALGAGVGPLATALSYTAVATAELLSGPRRTAG